MATNMFQHDPLAFFHERTQLMTRPRISWTEAMTTQGLWRCDLTLKTSSGENYKSSGQSRTLQEAKRAAAREILKQLPEPIVSVSDKRSMITALQRSGYILHLEGETVSVEVADIAWTFKLYLTGTDLIVIGPVSGKRKDAISYILEDACISLGHLASLRPERNMKLVERPVQRPKDLPNKNIKLVERSKDFPNEKEAYSSLVLKEFNANYTEGMSCPQPMDAIRAEDVETQTDGIRFLKAYTRDLRFIVSSSGDDITQSWVYSVLVNADSTPIATAGPCPYKQAKKKAIRDAVRAVDQRHKRVQAIAEGARLEKRARMDIA